ncbi:unnamed protein product, partial [Didymodactylos carnosus]
ITIIYFIFVPETLEFKVLHLYRKEITVVEKNENIENRPKLAKPWLPLIYLCDLTILPYILVATMSFTAAFGCQTLHSSYLARTPYDYNEMMIGFLYIPIGIALFTGSFIGGKLADRAASCKYFNNVAERRMIPGLILSLLLVPTGLILYGWSLEYGYNILIIICGQCLFGLGQANRPGILSYFTIKHQQQAASIISANNFVQILFAAIGIAISIPASHRLGIGPFITILALVNIVTIVVAGVLIYKKIKSSPEQ